MISVYLLNHLPALSGKNLKFVLASLIAGKVIITPMQPLTYRQPASELLPKHLLISKKEKKRKE